MRMNVAGIASAFIFLVAVSAIRMGDKPTFETSDASEAYAARITDQIKGAAQARAPKYVAPRNR